MNVRPAAVAGMFYPASSSALKHLVTDLLNEPLPIEVPAIKALIAPHAGYRYSGSVAASAYRLLAGKTFQRVLLLGPAHRVALRGLAASNFDAFETPLGIVPIDRTLRDRSKKIPLIKIRDDAHEDEHSLEVQLPFLQTILPDVAIFPLVVGQCSAEELAGAIEQLSDEQTLLLLSSDLSHYLPYDEAVEVDEHTIEKIEAAEQQMRGNEACGAYPLNGFLRFAHQHDWQIHCVDYRNSGDTAGKRDHVVGYASFVVH